MLFDAASKPWTCYRTRSCWAPKQEEVHSVARTFSYHGQPFPCPRRILSLQARGTSAMNMEGISFINSRPYWLRGQLLLPFGK